MLDKADRKHVVGLWVFVAPETEKLACTCDKILPVLVLVGVSIGYIIRVSKLLKRLGISLQANL